MTSTGDLLAETTAPVTDALSAALSALRVAGSVLLCEEYAAPWAIDIPAQPDLVALLAAPAGSRVVPFHLITRGTVTLRTGPQASRALPAGELVALFGDDAHVLGEGRARPKSLRDALRGVLRPEDGRAVTAAMVCGVFLLHDAEHNPLVRALPPVLQLAVGGATAPFVVRGVADLLVAELQAERRRAWVVARLVELLCAEAALSVATSAAPAPNWLRATQDRQVGAALDAFHAAPGTDWSVARLARHAALSPSRFAARFRDLTGHGPMAYVARWRLDLAARLLRESTAGIEQVANRVGYRSLPAFSRAYRRAHGVPPSAVRRR